MEIQNDFVHQLRASRLTVSFHTFAVYLSMSKSASYTIALAQSALFWAPSLLSGVFVAFIPSVTTSVAMFGFFAAVPNSLGRILPFAVTLAGRLWPFIFKFGPIWREEQQHGTSFIFAPIVTWLLALGPVFPLVALFGWKLWKELKLRRYLIAVIGPFLLLQFLREGRDHFQSSLAVTAVLVPWLLIVFTELARRLTTWPKDEEFQGAATFVVAAALVFLLFGGFMCSYRILKNNREFFSVNDIDISNAVLRSLPEDAVVLGTSRMLHPLVLTGRQQFLADRKLLLSFGFDIGPKLHQIESLRLDTTGNVWQELGVRFAINERQTGFQVMKRGHPIRQNPKYQLIKAVD
jgi:hypothetical protein